MIRPVLTWAVLVLLAAGAQAATQGVTSAERKLAIELQKRLTESKEVKVDDKTALAFARVYMRRAYVVDERPAQTLATEILAPGRRISEADELQYFAWTLDALVRNAKLEDVRTTLKDLLDSDNSNADKLLYAEAFLGVATQNVSPTPLMAMAKTAAKDGITGPRLRDLISWALGEVRRGEDPAHMARMYQAIRKITPLMGAQRDLLSKCYRGVRQGMPPAGLADAVVMLCQKYESDRLVEGDVDKIARLFLGGTSFADAVKQVIPPPKPPEK